MWAHSWRCAAFGLSGSVSACCSDLNWNRKSLRSVNLSSPSRPMSIPPPTGEEKFTSEWLVLHLVSAESVSEGVSTRSQTHSSKACWEKQTPRSNWFEPRLRRSLARRTFIMSFSRGCTAVGWRWKVQTKETFQTHMIKVYITIIYIYKHIVLFKVFYQCCNDHI